MGFCQPRNPNEALPVRLDLSKTCIELDQHGLLVLYSCLVFLATIQQWQTEKYRYASFYGILLGFHHTEKCQNILNTFILEIKAFLKKIMIIADVHNPYGDVFVPTFL